MENWPEEGNVFRGILIGMFLSLPVWTLILFGGYVLMHG